MKRFLQSLFPLFFHRRMPSRQIPLRVLALLFTFSAVAAWGQTLTRGSNGAGDADMQHIFNFAPVLTCDQQYSLTLYHLRHAEIWSGHADGTATVARPVSVENAYQLALRMQAREACEATDIKFLTDVDSRLYAMHLALTPEEEKTNRTLEQQQILKDLK